MIFTPEQKDIKKKRENPDEEGEEGEATES